MASIETRIIMLENLLPLGCETCAAWGAETLRVVFGEDDEDTDPDTCPDCGRDIPVGRRIVIRSRMDGPQ
jgi:hypothetical protein